jgi:hypothetical protein
LAWYSANFRLEEAGSNPAYLASERWHWAMHNLRVSESSAMLLLGLGAALGCGSSQPTLPDADQLVTIQQGVYGIITSEDDVGDYTVVPLGSFSILVYGDVPPLSIGQNGAPIVPPPLTETRSDERGFYQLELAAGRYVFCTSFLRCVWLDVPANQPVRLDYVFGLLGGWSQGEPVER